MSNMKTIRLGRGLVISLVSIAALLLTGCTGSEDSTAGSTTGKSESTAAQIASASKDNYDDNEYGLITAPTLKSWMDNWAANRPAAVTGKLVILQASDGQAGYEFIKPDGTNVFTYSVPSSEWVETRSNGVIETISMVPSGRAMDTFLAKYNIDPAKDMIVCGMGTGSTGTAMRAGRCWYMFRYWGTAKEHLASLNGDNGWNGANTVLDASYFSATGSTPPNTGSASVKDLSEVNVALQATVEDLMNVTPAMDVNLLNDGIFIWDARSTNQYSPTVSGDFQNNGAAQGHPNGALVLPFNNLLDASTGYSYKSKAAIQSYINGEDDGSGNSFLDSSLTAVGTGNAYQTGDVVYTYCETTFRAMITGFASAAILGLPTRFYDGAMVEWHSLSNAVDSNGDTILPWDSPWRTDKSIWSMFIYGADVGGTVAPRNIVDAYASSADAIIVEDLAYKGISTATTTTTTSSSTSSGSSGGSSLPANPCGG